MRLDPKVTRAKFEQEVRKLRGRGAMLRSWCCFEREITFPNVDLVFVPRVPQRITLPMLDATTLTAGQPASAQMAALDFPLFTTRAFGIRVAMDDFDLRAPSLEFRDPWTWERVTDQGMATRGLRAIPGGVQNITPPGHHPTTNRPFLCAQGVREYHEHPEHSGDDWMLHRGSIGLVELVTCVYETCVQRSRANLIFGGQIQVNFEHLPSIPTAPSSAGIHDGAP